MKKRTKSFILSTAASLFALISLNATALPFEEQEAFSKAQVSIPQAVDIVEKNIASELKEAKIQSIRFHHNKYGKDYFQVRMFGDNQVINVDVSAENGDILGTEKQALKKDKQPEDMSTAKISLEQAIDIAVGKTGGKVSFVDFKPHHNAFYTIETVVNDQENLIFVDAEEGKIVNIPRPDKPHDGYGKPPHFEHGKPECPPKENF